MTQEQIIENYKKYCPNLKSADLLLGQDYKAIQELEIFIKDGKVKADDVVKAFKLANESKFLRGEVNDFQASIRWLCNPVNIDKVLSGKYNRDPNRSLRSQQNKIGAHEYDFAQLEREIHQKNMAKLEKIRNDEDHQRWKEEEFYKKYPNLRPSEEEQ